MHIRWRWPPEKFGAALADFGGQPAGQLADELLGLGRFQRLP